MTFLQNTLYVITSGLLIPCITILLFLFGKGLVAIGRQIYVSKNESNLASLALWIEEKEALPKAEEVPEAYSSLSVFHSLRKLLTSDDASYSGYLVTNYEADTDKRLSQFGNMAKLGPVLGLIGTLIPMGPALQGLADGNIQQLAGQMQIAFTTTVVGLIVGAVGYILYQVNKREAIRELALLDYILEKKSGAS